MHNKIIWYPKPPNRFPKPETRTRANAGLISSRPKYVSRPNFMSLGDTYFNLLWPRHPEILINIASIAVPKIKMLTFIGHKLNLSRRGSRRETTTPDFLPPATKLEQGYVFTRVCDSVHGGVSVSVGGVWGVSIWGVSVLGGSLSRGGLCPGGSLSRGGLCPGDLCRGGFRPVGSLSGRGLCHGDPLPPW